MGRKKLHHDQSLGLVEMEDLRDRPEIAFRLSDKRVVLVIGAIERQRPADSDQAHIGQGLLDDYRALRPFHDEDEIQVAVADFLHCPSGRVGTDAFGNHGQRRKAGSKLFRG